MLLQNTPFFSALLVAAALTGIVPVGLNPTRRGAALARDVAHADCQLVLADSASTAASSATSTTSTSTRRSGPPRWRRTATRPSSLATPIRWTCSC